MTAPTLRLAAACTAAATAFILPACASTRPGVRLSMPRVAVEEVKTLRADVNGIVAEAVINIENPNSFAIKLDKLTYDLSFSGKPTATGTTVEQMSVPARGRAVIPVQMRAPYQRLLDAGIEFFRTGALPYELMVTATFNTLVGKIDVPLRHDGTLRLPSFLKRSAPPAVPLEETR